MSIKDKLRADSNIPLVGGIVAAIGASICCVGPFVLLLLGVSGSWISNLLFFEPYQPIFISVVVGLLAWSGWKIYQPIEDCEPGSVCAVPETRLRRQIVFWNTAVLALALVTSTYWLPLFFI